MAQSGSPAVGDVYNWQNLTDVVTTQASVNNLASGIFCYQDGTNGITVLPITSIPEAGRIRFLPVGVDNSGGSVGTFDVETIKSGAIVVAQCDGAIVVGDRVVGSITTAGRCNRRNATTAELEEVIGTYLGHSGELEETGSDPTDAADGDLVVIQMI